MQSDRGVELLGVEVYPGFLPVASEETTGYLQVFVIKGVGDLLLEFPGIRD